MKDYYGRLQETSSDYRRLPDIIIETIGDSVCGRLPETTGDYQRLRDYQISDERRLPQTTGLSETTGDYDRLLETTRD